MEVIKMLLVPAKILRNMWSYDFYNMELLLWITASSYDIYKYIYVILY